jgi:hypothetical protein
MAEEVSATKSESKIAKLRRAALRLLFALVLLIPKTLALRRKRRVWMAMRVALGIIGAVMVMAPLGRTSSWITGVVGLILFVIAALAGASRADNSVDNRARELGALVTVNGGHYEQAHGRVATVRLFVGAERIWAMDPALHPILVVPVNEIVSVRAAKSLSGWSLWLEWSGSVAEFTYDGFFAEHLARIAETTIRSVLRPPLSIIQQSQSAGA